MAMLSAQISLYVLGEPHQSPMIRKALDAFQAHGLSVQPGNMSTVVEGEERTVFEALREAFGRAAKESAVVMVATLSNACPALPRAGDG